MMCSVARAQAPAALDGGAVRAYLDRMKAHPAVHAGTERALGPRGFQALADAFRADAAAAQAALPRRPIPGAPRAWSQTGHGSISVACRDCAAALCLPHARHDHAFASHVCMHCFHITTVNSEMAAAGPLGGGSAVWRADAVRMEAARQDHRPSSVPCESVPPVWRDLCAAVRQRSRTRRTQASATF